MTVENWYGTKIERPLKAMREYVAILRACFAGEDPPAGEIFDTRFRFMGYEPRADLPIYVSALRRRCFGSPARSRTASCCGSATPTTSVTSSSRGAGGA